MYRETKGKVISVSKQWWMKVNTKAFRVHAMDGAAFPHIIKVSYAVDGKEYLKRKWIGAGLPVPSVGSSVVVMYRDNKPAKAKVL